MNSRAQTIAKHAVLKVLTVTEVLNILDRKQPISALNDAALFEFCEVANACYRAGSPIVSDAVYDHDFLAEVKLRDPSHGLLTSMDAEGQAFEGAKVELPAPMLSTDKAYSVAEIEKWFDRLIKAAAEIDVAVTDLNIRVTPKLDGFAGYDDGHTLYTRGDGRRGTDISRVFERGLPVFGNGERGQGPGEIVVTKSYFESHLSDYFEFARNFQASLIKEKALEVHAEAAISNKAAFFVPFAQLPAWEGSIEVLRDSFESVMEAAWESVDFDVDGVILETTHQRVKAHMGANRKYHRWQIALKQNAETAEVMVLAVTPQTGRTGKVTPVAELEPTQLSGATIRRATAHHYGMVKADGIGPGAKIVLTRSGMVIPKIEQVLVPVVPDIPEACPSCGHTLVWDSDALYCPDSINCPAQVANSMEYFFKTIANIDGFGMATIEKLYQNGLRKVSDIYAMTFEQLQSFGFGDKTARNLLDELQRSLRDPIEDWRFLGAFGVHRMGGGNCERLLQAYPMPTLFTLDEAQVAEIDGFAELSAQFVVQGLESIKAEFDLLYGLNFNLEKTELLSEADGGDSPLFGKNVCFTGKMLQGSRDDMKKQAKKMGAKVSASVTGKTHFLVIGEKVGATKIKAATDKGVKILTEVEYLTMIK